MSAAARILAIVPARGGSKGIPGKNLIDCGGQPLIDWTIYAARNSRRIDHILVSSDDARIIDHVRSIGCDAPFVRPPELATDTALVSGAVIHALDFAGTAFDHFVLLQPTSPLRTGEDIDGCIDACLQAGAPAAVSISEVRQSPYLMFRRNSTGTLTPLLEASTSRRQDLPKLYAVNGAVYVARRDWYLRSLTFFSPETASYIMSPDHAVDIDDSLDLLLADTLLKARQSGHPPCDESVFQSGPTD